MARQTEEIITSDVSGVRLRPCVSDPTHRMDERNTVVAASIPFDRRMDAAGSSDTWPIKLDLSPKEASRLVRILTERMTQAEKVDALDRAFPGKWREAEGATFEVRQYEEYLAIHPAKVAP